jgi:hypothetical protein
MSARQIACEEWPMFFDTFSRHYRGQLVEVQILGENLGVYSIAHGQPLMGITAEKTPGEIEVMTGDSSGHVTHVIKDPSAVWMQQGNNGKDSALKIEGKDGISVLVDFGPLAANANKACELPAGSR